MFLYLEKNNHFQIHLPRKWLLIKFSSNCVVSFLHKCSKTYMFLYLKKYNKENLTNTKMLLQMYQVYMFLYLENATIFILLYLVNVCWIKFTENVLLFVFYVNVLKIYMFLYLKKYNKENLLSTKFFYYKCTKFICSCT